MKEVRTTEDLMEQLSNMNKENSVCQVFIPGKGKFMIILQEEDYRSTGPVIQSNPNLKQMVNDSMEAEKEGRAMSASELMRNPFL
jgi:adenine-specific DNA methylase